MSPASTEQFLLEQYARHPASQLQDLRKALYQSVFGCEHLIADPSAAADYIRAEAARSGGRPQKPDRAAGRLKCWTVPGPGCIWAFWQTA